MQTQVPYFSLSEQNGQLREELMSAIGATLDRSSFCLGPDVDTFEKSFAAETGANHCIGLNSGTSALHLAMLLCNVGPGDEVITTPFTFAATSWAISYVGAKPVYVDIEPETCNIDPAKIEAAITPKTKAILPVHLYGHPCDMDAILEIAAKHNLPVVEDAAQAHGALYKDKQVGTIGTLGCFSFYPTKNLGTCGEGGAITTHDPALAQRAVALRNHGSYERYKYEEIGYNYRMEGLQGAVLNVKLPRLSKWSAARRRIAGLYTEGLKGSSLILPTEKPWAHSAWHLYVVRHPERDRIQKELQDQGIGSAIHYPIPLHLQNCYRQLGYKKGAFPVAERVADECLALPFYPELNDTQATAVITQLKRCLG